MQDWRNILENSDIIIIYTAKSKFSLLNFLSLYNVLGPILNI